MGLLNKLFGGENEVKEEKLLPWIPLNESPQLDFIQTKSSTKTQVIFKHSTRCGISRMVMKQFVDAYNFTEKDLDLYYLDLLHYLKTILYIYKFCYVLIHKINIQMNYYLAKILR